MGALSTLEWRFDDCLISTDADRLDMDASCSFMKRSYWAENRPREVMERAVACSLNFGVYERPDGVVLATGRPIQIGFARVISDFATFAYLCDVYIDETARGRGLGKRLIECVMAHPDLQGLRRFLLVTADAHGLYRQYGFEMLSRPDRWMERFNP